MKLEITNINYCWTVIAVNNLVELANCDNVQWIKMFGNQAIVSKGVKIWDVWILFTTEVELSDEYCRHNNLYRHSELNSDVTQKWYMEDNRRVKAIKFRWHSSSAMFMPLSSLWYLWDVSDLKIWDVFNSINWKEICKKYVKYSRSYEWTNKLKLSKNVSRIESKLIPEHLDSENYWRNESKINDDDYITVSQKLHGTSVRLWHCKVSRKLNWMERILSKFVKIDSLEYDTIWASRRVIKNGNFNVTSDWYYDNDVWKIIHDRYKDVIPHDYIIYWEIIWRDNEKPIQKWYTYNLKQWELEMYVYRISHVNDAWFVSDLCTDAMVDFCLSSWLKHVPILYRGFKKDFNVDEYMDAVYSKEYSSAISLSDEWTVDEWVIVRKEWIVPLLLKAKAPKFFEYESKQLDSWDVIDIESGESI